MKIKKLRGVKLGRKFVKVFGWTIRYCKKPTRIFSAESSIKSKVAAMAGKLKRGAKTDSKQESIRLGKVSVSPAGVPKGHLAVYVGESNGDIRRELVPVIYFNHPLFGELLKDAERIFGFNHPGGITIPVGHSEFQKAKARQDPEVQNILSDPVTRQVLVDFQENPKAVQVHMKNPMVMNKIQKAS